MVVVWEEPRNVSNIDVLAVRKTIQLVRPIRHVMQAVQAVLDRLIFSRLDRSRSPHPIPVRRRPLVDPLRDPLLQVHLPLVHTHPRPFAPKISSPRLVPRRRRRSVQIGNPYAVEECHGVVGAMMISVCRADQRYGMRLGIAVEAGDVGVEGVARSVMPVPTWQY